MIIIKKRYEIDNENNNITEMIKISICEIVSLRQCIESAKDFEERMQWKDLYTRTMFIFNNNLSMLFKIYVPEKLIENVIDQPIYDPISNSLIVLFEEDENFLYEKGK